MLTYVCTTFFFFKHACFECSMSKKMHVNMVAPFCTFPDAWQLESHVLADVTWCHVLAQKAFRPAPQIGRKNCKHPNPWRTECSGGARRRAWEVGALPGSQYDSVNVCQFGLTALRTQSQPLATSRPTVAYPHTRGTPVSYDEDPIASDSWFMIGSS